MKINQEEIEHIYNEHSRRLYFASLRILGNREEAEDVMQDTILKVCTDGSSSKAENLGAYLTRCCINKSLDLLRKRQSLKNYQTEIISARSQEEDGIDENVQDTCPIVEKIIELISRLPRKCRQIVTLKLIEGFDYQEIAQITSMNESSIRSRYMRGRQSLAELMKKEGIHERF